MHIIIKMLYKKKMLRLALVFTMASLFALWGCQKTPDVEAVTSKADGKLDALIHAEAVQQEQMVLDVAMEGDEAVDTGKEEILSAHWSEQVQIRELNCEIDADILIPAKGVFPVYEIEREPFREETLRRLLSYFHVISVTDDEETREELLLALKGASRGEYIKTENGEIWASYEGQEKEIKDLQDKLARLPEDQYVPMTSDIQIPGRYSFRTEKNTGIAVNANESTITIQAKNRYCIIQPESWLMKGEAIPGEPVGTTLQNVDITLEEACKRAEEFLQITGIRNLGMAESEKARIVEDISYDVISEGWYLTYTRNDCGCIPVYYGNQHSGVLYQRAESYAPSWFQEVLYLFVDEDGVQAVEWSNAVEAKDMVNENVLVLGFDTVKKNILQYIDWGYSAYAKNKGTMEDCSIKIEKIVLTNVHVPMADDMEKQLMVPAWLVFYRQYSGNVSFTSFIAVNAIDGSFIDLKVRFTG